MRFFQDWKLNFPSRIKNHLGSSNDQEDRFNSQQLWDQRNFQQLNKTDSLHFSSSLPLHLFFYGTIAWNRCNVCVFECLSSCAGKTRNMHSCILHSQLNNCDFLMKFNYKEDRRRTVAVPHNGALVDQRKSSNWILTRGSICRQSVASHKNWDVTLCESWCNLPLVACGW